MSKESGQGPNAPERLPLRWALIVAISLLAGSSMDAAGRPALAIGTIAVVALALHQIIR